MPNVNNWNIQFSYCSILDVAFTAHEVLGDDPPCVSRVSSGLVSRGTNRLLFCTIFSGQYSLGRWRQCFSPEQKVGLFAMQRNKDNVSLWSKG